MKIRLCTKAKLYSVREVNDFYFSIGYASGFNLHERSDLAHFPGALQSIWSRLQPTRSSYSKTRYYFNCPRRLNINLTLRWLALLQHLLRTEEVTTPPHMVVYCSPSAIFQGDEHLFTKVKIYINHVLRHVFYIIRSRLNEFLPRSHDDTGCARIVFRGWPSSWPESKQFRKLFTFLQFAFSKLKQLLIIISVLRGMTSIKPWGMTYLV